MADRRRIRRQCPEDGNDPGYDIRGTGYLFDESEAGIGTVPIEASFRTNAE